MSGNYIVISKEIANKLSGNNKNRDAYLYAYIRLCSDFQTGISHVRESKLSELTGIPENSISEAIGRLKKSGLFHVEAYSFRGEKSIIRRNRYCFEPQPKDFFYVRNEFFYEDISDELKGFLLRLKAICINDTNFTLYSVNRIAEALHSDNKTIKKYIDLGIEAGRLKKLDKGFALLDLNILPRWNKDGLCDEIYETISLYCIFSGVVPPRMDRRPLNELSVLFPISEEEMKEKIRENPHRREKIEEKYSLRRNLYEKCRKLPKEIDSLNYFIQALGGKEKKTEYKPMDLIILD